MKFTLATAVLGAFVATVVADDSEMPDVVCMDTPLTTDLWKVISKSDAAANNDDKLEDILYRHEGAAALCSNDKRGPVFWAWEYENQHALAALSAYGVNVTSVDREDGDGNTPISMCTKEEDACQDIASSAENIIEEIKTRITERKEREEEERKRQEQEDLDDDDEEDDDGVDDDQAEPVQRDSIKKSDDAGDLEIDVDDDDDADL